MKIHISFFLSVIFFNTTFSQSTSNFSLNGFVDTYHAVRVDDPHDFLSSRTRFRSEMKGFKDNSSYFVSLNAINNSYDKSLTGIELREAYVDYTSGSWGIRAGRQIITWGQADGIWITDLLSPSDYTEFLARDFDDIRIPVNSAKLKFFKNNFSNELVYVTTFEPFILAKQGSPWAFTGGIPQNIPTTLVTGTEPAKDLRNGEIANRTTFYTSGIDFSIVGLYTWNKLPTFQILPSDSGIQVTPHYYRLPVAGFDFTKMLGTFVFRGEFATYFNEFYQSNQNVNMVKRNSINCFIGADWMPGNDWMFSMQIYNKSILKYTKDIQADDKTFLSSLLITKKLFRNTLSLSALAFYDIDSETMFSRSSAEYSLSDNIKLTIGFDGFNGNKGLYGQFHNNDEVWFKAKYSF